MNEWQAYARAAFAVFAGQILRVGQKLKAGKPISWRNIFVMVSLMPAFGSMAGAAAVHFGWPARSILASGARAGRVNFGKMRFVLVIAKSIAGQLSAAKVD